VPADVAIRPSAFQVKLGTQSLVRFDPIINPKPDGRQSEKILKNEEWRPLLDDLRTLPLEQFAAEVTALGA
jgi:hypothetical protein